MRKVAFAAILIVLTALAAWTQEKPAEKPAPTKPAAAPALPAGAGRAMASISLLHIRAHVKFLSSDLLEGRGTGQRGGDVAAEYIATQFALYGLKPAGDNGTYLQKVPMVGITTQPDSKVSFVPAQGQPTDLKLGDDIVAMNQSAQPVVDIDAPLVFVGYGIEAPEYKWDDYKGVDVAGKVLLMLVNEPPSDDPAFFKGKALTYYGRWTYKYEEAARKGAVGAIIIHKTDMASYPWEVVRNSWGGESSYLKTEGVQRLQLASWIQLAVAQQLAATSGQSLAALMDQATKRDFHPVEFPVHVRAHVVSQIRPFESSNVIAMLPGSSPKLKHQAVIYSSHYDHLGIHPSQPGDNIYNGAIDNATGCGVLLEMARAYASAPAPPRSVLFAAVTGEEQGLLGSEYLGKHPPIPAGDISLGLNFDALAPRGIPERTQVTGSERTTFYPTVEAVARQFGLEITPDSNPGAGYYYRSDHFSLARVGVPAFSVNEGMQFKGHPREWAIQQENEYREKHYHQPSDEFHDDWDFSGVAVMTRFGFELGWKAASQPGLVGWQPGDEFAPARKASQTASGKGDSR